MLENEVLNRLRALNDTRSGGPWAIRPTVGSGDEPADCIIAKGYGNLTIADDMDPDSVDAQFIVYAANNMLALLNEIESLRASLTRAEESDAAKTREINLLVKENRELHTRLSRASGTDETEGQKQ